MLVEFLINKDLIDCEKLFVYEAELPNFGVVELKDFLNTYILGLHLAYFTSDLTENSDVFFRKFYKDYQPKKDYGMDYDLVWLNTFGKKIILELHKLPNAAIKNVLYETRGLEVSFQLESYSEILMALMINALLDLNKKLDNPVNVSVL